MQRIIEASCLGILGTVFIFQMAWGDSSLADKVEKPLKESIHTRQKSQLELDQWEEARLKLQAQYDALTLENDGLTKHVATLKKQEVTQKALNVSLALQERESRRISEEIGPFSEVLFSRLENFIAADAPFLKEERKQRLGRLRKVLDDPEVGVAEKFRKVMEAVFIEAEYGNTIEVYQEKIQLGQDEILGDIFRLGRISLFFLSLDQKSAAYFNVADQKWMSLSGSYAPSIQAAIEMGSKRRPIELLCLPVGRLGQ